MVRVLVTGGAGFIGSHLARRLARDGRRVCVLDNLRAGRWTALGDAADDVVRIEGDVRDGAALRRAAEFRPEVVFHLAANASVPGSVEDPRYDFESNCAGTFRLLQSLRGASPQPRVVLASSGAVYGQPHGFPITESTPLDPISPYGASKVSAECEARMFFRVYGMDVVIARIFNTYGPGMPRFVALDFLKKLRRRADELEILGDGKQVRDFNYIDDTVAGLIVLAERGEAGRAYNLASGRSGSVTDLAEAILRIRGLAGRTRLVYTGASWTGDAQRWEVDISRIVAAGYRPAVDLEEGLRRTVRWFDEPGSPAEGRG